MGSPAHVYKEILEEIARISEIPLDKGKKYTIEELQEIILEAYKNNRDILLYHAGIATSNIINYWIENSNDMFNAGLGAMLDLEYWLGLKYEDDDEE